MIVLDRNEVDAQLPPLRLEDREPVPFTEARSVIARAVADELDDPAAVLTEWAGSGAEAGAGSRISAEADRRGIVVPPEERAELERAWADVLYQWSASFGFRFGMTTSEVGRVAMEALSNPGQGVELARRDVVERRSLIEARYPPVFPPRP